MRSYYFNWYGNRIGRNYSIVTGRFWNCMKPSHRKTDRLLKLDPYSDFTLGPGVIPFLNHFKRFPKYHLIFYKLKILSNTILVNKHTFVKTLRGILIAVRARNQKYDKSPTFSITVDVPRKHFAYNLPLFLIARNSSYLSD